MSLLTSISNKVQYQVAQAVADPKADEYAKQQELQKKQDEEVKAREEVRAADEANKAKLAEEKAKADEDIARRSKFNVNELISDSARYILIGTLVLVILSFMMYGGHIAANDAIGYSIWNRLLAFFYGSLMSWFLVPKALYHIFWLGQSRPYYTFLPLFEYVPNGFLEQVVIGPFAYQADDASRKAKEAIRALYEKGTTFTNLTMNQYIPPSMSDTSSPAANVGVSTPIAVPVERSTIPIRKASNVI